MPLRIHPAVRVLRDTASTTRMDERSRSLSDPIQSSMAPW